EQIDRDVPAAVACGSNSPEDQDAKQHAPEVITVRNLIGEEVAQQHRNEDVGRDHADEERGNQFDAVDETVHLVARWRDIADCLTGNFLTTGFRFGLGHAVPYMLSEWLADGASGPRPALPARAEMEPLQPRWVRTKPCIAPAPTASPSRRRRGRRPSCARCR